MMRDLVQDGVPDELCEVPSVPRSRLERASEQRDAVRHQRRVLAAFGPRHALVEAEEDLVAPADRIGGRHVGDRDLHVGEVRQEVLRERGDRVVDESDEAFDAARPGAVDRAAVTVDVPAAVACMTIAHAGHGSPSTPVDPDRRTSLPNDIDVVYRPSVLANPAAALSHPRDPRAERPCVRPGCTLRATSTLRFDYSARTVMLDPLRPDPVPGEYDLCLHHAARSTPPTGWVLRDRAPSRDSASEPQPPVGPDRGHDVARLAAALSAVDRAVSEDAPDAAPVGTDRSVARAPEVSGATRLRGTSRLDSLLQPSTRPEPAPSSGPAPEVEVRRAPQPLRLAPDPTTTVWCADLLAGPSGPAEVRATVQRPSWSTGSHTAASASSATSGDAPTLFG